MDDGDGRMTVNAVVLAGRANTRTFQNVSTAASEALIPVAGRPMLEWVLAALLAVPAVGGCAVVGPPDHLAWPVRSAFGTRVEVVPSGPDLLDNVLRGVRHFAADGRPLLVSTSDLPLLEPAGVAAFIEAALALGADFCYPIIPRDAMEAAYPGVRRTYARVRDGTFTGGNLVLLNPAVAEAVARRAQAFIAARKSPFRLAMLLGPGFLVRLGLGRLTVADLEQKVSSLFGMTARALVTRHASIGMDVDKLSHLRVAESILGVSARPWA